METLPDLPGGLQKALGIFEAVTVFLFTLEYAVRLFTVVILLTGLGIVAVPTGLLTSALNRVREEEMNQERSGSSNESTDSTKPN